MFMDSSGTKTRITSQIYDMGVDKLDSLIEKVKPDVDKILNPDKGEITALVAKMETGTTEEKASYLDSILFEFPYVEFAYLAYLKESGSDKYEEYDLNGLNFDEVVTQDMEGLKSAIDLTYIGNQVTGFTVPFAKGTKYLIAMDFCKKNTWL